MKRFEDKSKLFNLILLNGIQEREERRLLLDEGDAQEGRFSQIRFV